MSDLTMCANSDGCPMRDSCRRYTARASEPQSFAMFNVGWPCEDFVDDGEVAASPNNCYCLIGASRDKLPVVMNTALESALYSRVEQSGSSSGS